MLKLNLEQIRFVCSIIILLTVLLKFLTWSYAYKKKYASQMFYKYFFRYFNEIDLADTYRPDEKLFKQLNNFFNAVFWIVIVIFFTAVLFDNSLFAD